MERKEKVIHNPDLERKEQVTLKDLLTQARQRKNNGKMTGLGHISFARETLRAIKKEVGKEEYETLGPGAAFYVVCKLMEQKKPDLYKKVMSQVGKTLYRSEVGQLYYRVRDEK